MFGKLFTQSKKILTSPQNSILSAASVIMIMVIASRVLGLVRQRFLAHYFAPGELSLFFAGLRLPELVFEILVFGTISSAFIPVFTKSFSKHEKEAWNIAGRVVNLGLFVFSIFAIILSFASAEFYSTFAPGYSESEVSQIAALSRVLFVAQGFFVISYVFTGVLESLKRFLFPALAPVFYNVGIILGIVFLTPRFGIFAPALGVLLGSATHFLIQLPLSMKLGFRFVWSLKPNRGVKKIVKLAFPRMVDLSFYQVAKTVELFMASLISSASYTYLTFANTLQLLPVSLFGISLAKASLPTLSGQSDDLVKFRKTLFTTLYEIVFFVLPFATVLMVLRVPIVRLVFGASGYDWEATVQTGLVLTAFSLSIVFQSAAALLARGFYALDDTKTPVTISILGVLLVVVGDIYFVRVLSLSTWSLALSFSIGSFFQATTLFYILVKRIDSVSIIKASFPMLKSLVASVVSGATMFFLLKLFDRSVWVKRLSFVGSIEGDLALERFVLDTRFTFNVFVLTVIVSVVGAVVYLLVSYLLKSQELGVLLRLIRYRRFGPPPAKEEEPLSPPASETTST